MHSQRERGHSFLTWVYKEGSLCLRNTGPGLSKEQHVMNFLCRYSVVLALCINVIIPVPNIIL